MTKLLSEEPLVSVTFGHCRFEMEDNDLLTFSGTEGQSIAVVVWRYKTG